MKFNDHSRQKVKLNQKVRSTSRFFRILQDSSRFFQILEDSYWGWDQIEAGTLVSFPAHFLTHATVGGFDRILTISFPEGLNEQASKQAVRRNIF